MLQSTLHSCFSNYLEHPKNVFKQKESLIEVITDYYGIFYDRIKYLLEFTSTHKNNPYKSKSLKIKHLTTYYEIYSLKENLKNWIKEAKILASENYSLANQYPAENVEGGTNDQFVHFTNIGWSFALLQNLATTVLSIVIPDCLSNILHETLLTTNRIITVNDVTDHPQAIAIIDKDKHHPTACKISYLFSAPHNLLKNNSNRFEGAATALIEEAFVQSLQYRGICTRAAKRREVYNSAITLVAADDAMSFYEHIYFQSTGPSQGCKILTGSNLMLFLKKYAGRAKCSIKI